MDNAPIHRKKECFDYLMLNQKVLFNTPYTPALINPIENAFNFIKTQVRLTKIENESQFLETIHAAICNLTQKMAQEFILHTLSKFHKAYNLIDI